MPDEEAPDEIDVWFIDGMHAYTLDGLEKSVLPYRFGGAESKALLFPMDRGPASA